MDEPQKQVGRARAENRVMAELAALAGTDEEYDALVQSVLRLLEEVVVAPYLGLSIGEPGKTSHYARPGEGTDPDWAEAVGGFVADLCDELPAQPAVQRLTAPEAWIATVPVQTRSGRFGALALGSQEPLLLSAEEQGLMLRLASQVLLVLDHALLLQQLEQQEVTDSLTGVMNQRRLLEMLDYELLRHRHAGRGLALLVVDVEGLSAINQSYGHRYGNHILTKLAGLLADEIRPIDVLARCGTDEFAILLPETNAEEAEHIAEDLRERMLATEFAGGAIGLSIGVGHVNPSESLTAEELLRRAEGALHAAKRQDRAWSAITIDASRSIR